MATIVEGTAVNFVTSTPFTSIAGTVINPDLVYFKYSVQGQTEVTYTWTNPTGDPTAHITNPSTGNFSVTLPTDNLAGIWAWGWSCAPSSGTDVTKTQVVWESQFTVSQRALP